MEIVEISEFRIDSEPKWLKCLLKPLSARFGADYDMFLNSLFKLMKSLLSLFIEIIPAAYLLKRECLYYLGLRYYGISIADRPRILYQYLHGV